jgi:EamA domain-containing membrane protein RarD
MKNTKKPINSYFYVLFMSQLNLKFIIFIQDLLEQHKNINDSQGYFCNLLIVVLIFFLKKKGKINPIKVMLQMTMDTLEDISINQSPS